MADSKFKIKAVISADDRASRSIARIGLSIRAGLNTALTRTRLLANRAALSIARMGYSGLKTGLMAIAGGATIATYALVKLTKAVAASLDRTAKFSRQLKISADELSAYRYASEIAGVGAEKLDKNIAFFTKTLGQAKAGTGALVTYLKKTDSAFLNQLKNTKDTGDAFELYIAKIGSIKDPTARAAMATAGFGGAGLDMITMSEGGAEALSNLKKEFYELSGLIGKDATDNAEAFDDSMLRVITSIKGVGREIATKLFPVFIPLFNRLAKWIGHNRELISSKIVTWIDETIKTVKVAIPVFGQIAAEIRNTFAGLLGIEGLDTKAAFEKIRKSISEINVKGLCEDIHSFSESLKSLVNFMQDNTQVVKDFFTPFAWGAKKVAVGAGMVTRFQEQNPKDSAGIDLLGSMIPVPGAALFMKLAAQKLSRNQEIMDAFAEMPEGATPVHRTFGERIGLVETQKEEQKTRVDVNVKFENTPRGAVVTAQSEGGRWVDTRVRKIVGRTLVGAQ